MVEAAALMKWWTPTTGNRVVNTVLISAAVLTAATILWKKGAVPALHGLLRGGRDLVRHWRNTRSMFKGAKVAGEIAQELVSVKEQLALLGPEILFVAGEMRFNHGSSFRDVVEEIRANQEQQKAVLEQHGLRLQSLEVLVDRNGSQQEANHIIGEMRALLNTMQVSGGTNTSSTAQEEAIDDAVPAHPAPAPSQAEASGSSQGS